MVFKFADKTNCINGKLEQIKGDLVVDIEYAEFRKSSAKKIEDILMNGVKGDNQDLVIDNICLSKESFKKLSNYGYKASFNTLGNIGGDTVAVVTFTLSNIDLRFNDNHVEYNGNNVVISLANITVYPYGKCYFEELRE